MATEGRVVPGWLQGPARGVVGAFLAVTLGCSGPGDDGEGARHRGDAAESSPAGRRGTETPLSVVTDVRFTEVARQWGVDFVHESGSQEDYSLPAIMGGGAAVFDSDNDGDLDLYLVNSGNALPGSGRHNTAINRLYRQGAAGRFSDETGPSGLGDGGYGMGCAVGDYDNDGDLDVYVTNWGTDSLYRNQGNGTFTEVAAASGIQGSGFSTSATFLDYDRDGYLDLYVTRYVEYDPERRCTQEGGRPDYCGPTQFPPTPDRLYRNLGDGRFRDTTREAGIAAAAGAGLGVVAVDLNDDGWVDIYVANDAHPNQLWINQRDGTFSDEAILQGAAFSGYGVAEAGMGVTAGDGDSDGDLDLFVSHLIEETNTYYENRGDEGFEDTTSRTGLGMPSLPYTGFGTAFFDFDHDGDLDLGVANGGVKRRPVVLGSRHGWFWNAYAEPNLLLLNQGAGTFADVTAQAGDLGDSVEVSRGLIPADLDADGDLDLVVTQIEGPVRLYRNEGPGGDSQGAWMEIRLLDPRRKREALGARVTVITGEGRYVRYAIPPGGYLTSGHGHIHLGLGGRGSLDEDRVLRFEVRWPDGEEESFPGAPAGGIVELRRGEGRAGELGREEPG